MTCVVIGGSGFIGTRLIEDLINDFRIVNIDKAASAKFDDRTFRANILDIEAFSDSLRGASTVILLAAEHRDDVSPQSLYQDVNVQGMRNVLAAMDANGVRRIIFTSTVAVYGLDRPLPPTESDPLLPFNEYSRTKVEAERVLQTWASLDPTRHALIIRPTVIFGEGNRGNVYNLVKQIYSGRFLMIGSGQNRKSMAYVGNLAAFIRHMLTRGWDGITIYNYVDLPDLDMNTLVAEVCRSSGRPLPKFRLPYALGMLAGYCFDLAAAISNRRFPVSAIRVRKFCASTQVDGTKLTSTGFVPPYSLEKGLARMIQADFPIARGVPGDAAQ